MRVVVVGGGVVGMSTAWFLREQGADVTLVDSALAGQGASWGNAGWLTPGIATPLPDPSILAYGIKAVFSPSTPVYVPLAVDPDLWRFLTRFLRNSTAPRWRSAMQALIGLNTRAFDAFDALAAGGRDGTGAVVVPTITPGTDGRPPFVAAYTDPTARQVLTRELDQIRTAGQDVDYTLLDGDEVRSLVPAVSRRVTAGIRLAGTRFIDPPRYVAALREAVLARGVELAEGVEVRRVDDDGREGIVETVNGEQLRADAVVIATGAQLGRLAGCFGVRTQVRAGRGYSFSVEAEPMPTAPVYFPVERVACTPLGAAADPSSTGAARFRVAGMMEFRRADAPFDPRRVEAIVRATRPLFADLRADGVGIDLDRREHEWVGSRPCTPDGLPVIGRTRSPRIHVAGGHGMWGVTLGPVTGQLLADLIVTGTAAAALTAFDPLR